MSKKKIVEQIACPACGEKRDVLDAHLYTCVDCEKQGFDCCVPGSHAICLECEDAQP